MYARGDHVLAFVAPMLFVGVSHLVQRHFRLVVACTIFAARPTSQQNRFCFANNYQQFGARNAANALQNTIADNCQFFLLAYKQYYPIQLKNINNCNFFTLFKLCKSHLVQDAPTRLQRGAHV